MKLGIREEERLTEDEIARRKLGPSRCAGWSGFCENDAATRKEYSQDRRLRRPYPPAWGDILLYDAVARFAALCAIGPLTRRPRSSTNILRRGK